MTPKEKQNLYPKGTKVLDIHGQIWEVEGPQAHHPQFLVMRSKDPDPLFKNSTGAILPLERITPYNYHLEQQLKTIYKAIQKAHKRAETLKDIAEGLLLQTRNNDKGFGGWR